ncbi:MAG: NAD(P)-dependent dehydrogenase (short-subunit alcohol dehydrogenase family) [Pseudomonadales bacterium]|jgi:NAD(P)-dependent dehydrogenase (short-subunit alcohol dehydrogenase family)
MDSSMLLKDKVCVITGAGKGIGSDCAKLFAQQGAKLALISRTESDLLKLAEELNLTDDRLIWCAGDVSDEKTVRDFTSLCIDHFGHIDALINNAGMRMRKPFLEMSYADWSEVTQVNAGSVFLFCHAVGAHMVKRKQGKIINMASIVGTLGLAELVGYGASKGAVISLTKGLAVEWAEHNINVNVIAPGFCETSYADAFKQKTDLYNFTIDRTPMKKWGTGKDIANACLYLASEMSDYVTGDVLNVDGGWSAW